MLISLSVSAGGVSLTTRIGVYSDAITFTFDTNYTVGTYWNGDPWVLRPGGGDVTITATSPTMLGDGTIADSIGVNRVRHGSMWNWNTGSEAELPTGGSIQGTGTSDNGWDSHNPKIDSGGGNTITNAAQYSDVRNIDPENTGVDFVASTAGAFMKALSDLDTTSLENEARPQILEEVGLLTVVDTAPPANAFRPGAHTTTKAHRWLTSDLDFSAVPSGLTAPASAPTYATALSKVEKHHIMGSLNYDSNRILMPSGSMHDYGANNAEAIVQAVLLAMTDGVTTEERETLLKSVVQIGIDVYDRYNEGGRWNPLGGLYTGYKLPLVLAATLLDDTSIKAVADANPNNTDVFEAFHEDRQIWVLTSSDTGRTLDGGNEQYIASDEGDPEWGEQHTKQNGRDDRRENATYRAINHQYIVPAALACQMITGARTNWNWQPFFDYADRIMERDWFASGETIFGTGTVWIDENTDSNTVSNFHQDMWTSFRASYGGAIWNR